MATKRYMHAQEIWSAAKCEKLAKRRETDAFGSKGPKGLVSSFSTMYGPRYGTSRDYNPGCERDGEWYKGESWPLPQIPEGFYFESVASWGLFIRKGVKETK